MIGERAQPKLADPYDYWLRCTACGCVCGYWCASCLNVVRKRLCGGHVRRLTDAEVSVCLIGNWMAVEAMSVRCTWER